MCLNTKKIIVNGEEVTVKCGKCTICKRQRASDWAIKLIKESEYYKKSCFITLTFDDKILCDKNSKGYKFGANYTFTQSIKNSKEYVTKFIKRLRKYYEKNYNKKIKYFKIGEYGEKFKRPHWHILIFGINFDEDREKAEISKSGKPQFASDTLTNLWACGRCRIQDVNDHNIAYISMYNTKKLKLSENEETFKQNYIPIEVNEETGAIKWEYKYKPSMSFSNRAKFNAKWIRHNYEQIAKGYLTDKDNKKYRIPKSYVETLKKSDWLIHNAYYDIYEENLNEHIMNLNNKEQKREEEQKAIILERRAKIREF